MNSMIGISALHFDLEQKLKVYHDYDDIKFIEYGVDEFKDLEILNFFMSKPENRNVNLAIHLPLKSNPVENIEDIRNSNIKFISEMIREILQFEPLYFNLHLGHAFFNKYQNDPLIYLDNANHYLNVLLNVSLKYNIYIENVYSFLDKASGDLCSIGTTAKEFEYIFSKNKDLRLGFCYDLGHSQLQKENFDGLLKQKNLLFHFNVNEGLSDQHLGVQKTGKYTKTFFFEIINQYDFKYVVLELDINETLKTIDILMLK